MVLGVHYDPKGLHYLAWWVYYCFFIGLKREMWLASFLNIVMVAQTAQAHQGNAGISQKNKTLASITLYEAAKAKNITFTLKNLQYYPWGLGDHWPVYPQGPWIHLSPFWKLNLTYTIETYLFNTKTLLQIYMKRTHKYLQEYNPSLTCLTQVNAQSFTSTVNKLKWKQQ